MNTLNGIISRVPRAVNISGLQDLAVN